MATSLFDVVPLLSHCTSTRFQGTISCVSTENSCGLTGNFILMMELRKEILTFRDVIDLPPCDGSSPIHELVMGTVEDLHNLYPKVVSYNLAPETEKISIEQGLILLYKALKSVGDSWAKNHKWIDNTGDDSQDSLDNIVALEQIGGKVMSKLNHATRVARQIFDAMDEDERNADTGIFRGSTIGDALTESFCNAKRLKTCPSPNTPSTEPYSIGSATKPLLLPFRLKAVQTLKPVGIKNLFSLDLSPVKHKSSSSSSDVAGESPVVQKEKVVPPKPPPPPPTQPSMPGPTAPPPPPVPPAAVNKGSSPPPPPPPGGAAKALRAKKAATKLKRSSHMGNLYRSLKGKVEGCSSSGSNGNNVKRSHKVGVGSSGGRQGMADALAEMTKRSAYFQQIERDVEKHSKSVLEVKAAINSFQTKDMSELVKFHEFVEQHLEKLTDETQVLARFEGFPTKKLESLRTATALYLKLEEMVNTLKNWKVVPPLTHLLDKVESFFNKIKREIDALERTNDEDSKRFQSHNITFDFNILYRIKEAMVDVSSSCMELTLKERKNTKMLWRAFQFAFRVYSFAGGQDERADALTHELAHQIQTDH